VKVAKLPDKLVNNEGKFVMVGIGTIPKDDTKIPGAPPRKTVVQGLSDENCDVECKNMGACQDVCASDPVNAGGLADDFVCGKNENKTLKPSCNGDSGGELVF